MPSIPHTIDVRLTRAERLLTILADGRWHDTAELVERVGHSFAVAKYHLAHGGTAVASLLQGEMIEVRRHPTAPRQFQYRLANTAPAGRRRRRPKGHRRTRRQSQPKGGDSV